MSNLRQRAILDLDIFAQTKMENGRLQTPQQQRTLGRIFRDARGDLTLREFCQKLNGEVGFAALARIERDECRLPTDRVLAAVSPYTRPFMTVEQLKMVALGVEFKPVQPCPQPPKHDYEEALALAEGLSHADRVRLIKALVEGLGHL